VTLAAGDAIVVYSDGILDATTDGVALDERHVEELLAGVPQSGAQALVDRLWAAVSGAELRDDVAIMALRPSG
jgi:serine phosphatase RsbU (regulator of sigma subunit)